MEKDKHIEKIYELVELYDFDELSEDDRSFVLEHISVEEYSRMRETITETKNLFEKSEITYRKDRSFKVKKIIAYPVELYKIAALLILFFGTGYTISSLNYSHKRKLIAATDTIYTNHVDTFVVEKTDTIEIIKERLVYRDNNLNQNYTTQIGNEAEIINNTRDCSKDICPGDIALLSKRKTTGDFSKDTSLTQFIVAVN
ncbi:MAG: hypothetical protein JXB49_31950 [Bacteroidales bacterium]|nr:hypothetical protein [Bacteroidales bacterium]